MKKVMDKGSLSSDLISPPSTLKEEDEIFLGSFEGNVAKIVGLFAVTSVGEEGLGLKPEIQLTEKMLELQASEIKSIEEPLKKGIYSLDPEDYDRFREGLERLGMEESIGGGLTIPG